MSKDDKPAPKPQGHEKMEKGGYQPVNEGYAPLNRRGYTPEGNANTSIPPLPSGGTAQSPKPDEGKADSK